MHEPTEAAGARVEARLAELAAGIGELTREHERLRRTATGDQAADPDRPAPPGHADAAEIVERDDALRRSDRIDYVRTTRQALFRLLYVIDATLVTGLPDRARLREARTALINGIDAADACLLLDGFSDVPPASDE